MVETMTTVLDVEVSQADATELAQSLPQPSQGALSSFINSRRNDNPEWRAAVMQEALTWLRKGMSLAFAARQAGVSRRSLVIWREKYPDFGRDVIDAMNEDGCDELEDLVRLAAKQDWRAADRLLQVRRRSTWGKTDAGTTINLTNTATAVGQAAISGPTAAWIAETIGGGSDAAPAVDGAERPVLPADVPAAAP